MDTTTTTTEWRIRRRMPDGSTRPTATGGAYTDPAKLERALAVLLRRYPERRYVVQRRQVSPWEDFQSLA